MARHGSIGKLDAGRENWVSYKEGLSLYFMANGIADDEAAKKREVYVKHPHIS